jgi:hypothetical protein
MSGTANGAAVVASVAGAMPAVAAQAAMAQAAISMAECTRVVPETPLTFPQSLAPGFSLGALRAGYYRGAMAASVASLVIGGLLILAAGYTLQRLRPDMAGGETGVFLRSLTAVMAPGSAFTIVSFNVDPVIGSAAALLQIGEEYTTDAPVAVCGVAVLGLCVWYMWRAVRRATDPKGAACCLHFDPAARVVPPFKQPPLGLRWLTPVVLSWCFYGTGAWVDAGTAAVNRRHTDDDIVSWRPPSIAAAGRRIRTAIGALRGDSSRAALDHASYKLPPLSDDTALPTSKLRTFANALLPRTHHYVFFALGCTAATSVLRSVRFSCAAQLWLLAFVQCGCLGVLLARAPYAVPARNALSVLAAVATGAAYVCLAVDATSSEGHDSIKALGQKIAVAASMLSYPTLAITFGQRALLLLWLRQHRDAAAVRASGAHVVISDDELIDVALLGARINYGAEPPTADHLDLMSLSSPAEMPVGVVHSLSIEAELNCPPLLIAARGETLMPLDATPPDDEPLLGDFGSREPVDDELYGVDGMRFTRHAQDGEDQIDGSRLNPLRRAARSSAMKDESSGRGAGREEGADTEVDERRRRTAMAAAAIAAVDDDGFLTI